MTGLPDPADPRSGPPTNPVWVRYTVIGLIILTWIATAISVALGDDGWVDPVLAAIAATLCLSAVDLGIDLSRKRARKD